MHKLAPVIILSIMFFGVVFMAADAVAQAFSASSATDYIWTRFFGFQRSWLSNPRELMVNVIVPCLAIFFITLGMMRATRVTRSMGNIEYMIALVIMLAALFSGGVSWLNTYLLAFMGQFAFVAFAAMFIVGTFFYSWSYMRGARNYNKDIHDVYKKTMGNAREQANKIDEEIGKLKDKIDEEKNPQKQDKLREKIGDLRLLKQQILDEEENVQQRYRKALNA